MRRMRLFVKMRLFVDSCGALALTLVGISY
jgi:hypothetical protein